MVTNQTKYIIMKKSTLLFLLSIFAIAVQGQIYLPQETFDTGLGAWTVTDGGTATGDSWASGAAAVGDLNGSNTAFVDSDANGNGVRMIETLTSPAFDTTTGTGFILLQFEQFYRHGSIDTGAVEVWDGTAWQQVLLNNATVGASGAPDVQSIDVSAYSNAAMQVRFVYDDADIWAWYWLIDNVTVVEGPACPDPTDLTTTNITSDSADLGWMQNNPAVTSWNVELVDITAGGTATGTATATGVTNPYSAMGLAASNDYEFYVQASCSMTWVGPFAFSTTAACPDPTTLTATNITDTSADLGWTQIGGVMSWDIELVDITGGETATGTATATGVTNPYSASGLAASNDYEFYVQADCSSTWVGPFAFTTAVAPPANDTCAGVIDLGTQTSPLTASTVGALNDFGQDCLTNAAAPDVVYSILVPDGSTLTIEQTSNAYDSKHRLAYGAACPGDMLITCLDDPDTSQAVWVNTTGSDQTAYWIQSAFSTGSGNYTLAWSVVSCTSSTATFSVVGDCTGSGGFFIDVEVTDTGSASTVNITDDQGGSIPMVGVGTHQLGPYVNGTNVITTVENGDNTSCTVVSPALTQEACPPVNDDCGTATVITPSIIGAETWIVGTTVGNTASGITASCGNSGSGRDTWFTVTVPTTLTVGGEFVITTQADGGSPLLDTVMAVFSDCAGNEILCDDDAGPGNFSQITLTGGTNVNPNDVLYIRVNEYNADASKGPQDGTFQISAAATEASLSTSEFENENLFSYYPNPVTNSLTLNAQKNISSVTVYNMLGQTVIRTAPNTTTKDIDMSNLESGAYFVKVAVGNTVDTIKVIKN